MNIKEAKDELKNAIAAYLTKDRFGNYVISVEKQRPIFLMGPPGIGKTAIMEQIAQELGIGLVSYSMTHHTRQSALGLPFIAHKVYGGVEFDVSEYTMSEIIATVYEMMEVSGVKDGILFLDEINCVSETLAPSMLQFLQFKTFGRHRVPDGWVVVTAGNPPEYNNSVREFDIVTWDRLKRIDVEPDFAVWKEYALGRGVHPAVLTYLDTKKADFYLVETTVDGKKFATARGWEDLSAMINLYEQKGIAVKRTLVGQYIQENRIARDFAAYYDLFIKYRSDYQVDRIIEGAAKQEIYDRAAKARFDERLALLGLILDVLFREIREANTEEETFRQVVSFLRSNACHFSTVPGTLQTIENKLGSIRDEIARGKRSSSISPEEIRAMNGVVEMLNEMVVQAKGSDESDPYERLKKIYSDRLKKYRENCEAIKKHIDNAFMFCVTAFGEGQEVLLLVTELSANKDSTHFISRNGSDEYFKHNKGLLFYERRKEILEELNDLGL